MSKQLKFGKANAKLKDLVKYAISLGWFKRPKLYTFSLLSGYTCPFAKDCLSFARERADGTRYIEDGKHTQFRCFSASDEVRHTPVYESRKHNTDILRSLGTTEDMRDVILRDLPKAANIVRIHIGGDFFNSLYFNAWLQVAKANPDVMFYAYTKSLPFWVKARSERKIPKNFILTASRGGWKDGLIKKKRLRGVEVVFSEEEANSKGLEIDHDDSHAADPALKNRNFALLIHGTQPAGSNASKAKSALAKKGWTGYSK